MNFKNWLNFWAPSFFKFFGKLWIILFFYLQLYVIFLSATRVIWGTIHSAYLRTITRYYISAYLRTKTRYYISAYLRTKTRYYISAYLRTITRYYISAYLRTQTMYVTPANLRTTVQQEICCLYIWGLKQGILLWHAWGNNMKYYVGILEDNK